MTEETGKTIYEFALNSLVADCIREYTIRNAMYKDAWLDMDVETLKHIVKGEAGKLVATDDLEKLVHRFETYLMTGDFDGKIAEPVEPYGTSTGKMTQMRLFD